MVRRSGKTHPAVFLLALALGAVYLALRYRVTPVIALVLAAVGGYAAAGGTRMIIRRKAGVPSGAGSIGHWLGDLIKQRAAESL